MVVNEQVQARIDRPIISAADFRRRSSGEQGSLLHYSRNSYSHQIGRHYAFILAAFPLSKGSERRGSAPRFNFQTSNGSQCRGRELSRNPR